MDPLVLYAHDDDPPERILVDGPLHGLLLHEVVHEHAHVPPEVEHLLQELDGRGGVRARLRAARPHVRVRVPVVPAHLVDAHRHLHLEHRVQPMMDELAQVELVDVERRGVPEVEYGWVPQSLVLLVNGRHIVEHLMELLEQGEGLVEVQDDLRTQGFQLLDGLRQVPVVQHRRGQPFERRVSLGLVPQVAQVAAAEGHAALEGAEGLRASSGNLRHAGRRVRLRRPRPRDQRGGVRHAGDPGRLLEVAPGSTRTTRRRQHRRARRHAVCGG
mmetsp:Transcript_11228/g.33295  ORF Transcript_11228/g.33295 Transcript_11228/m.33295 type:complete len:272 (-) Transcript_11228:122-937(-)